MNTSAQHLLSRLPPASAWGRLFRDLCLGTIGSVVIAALGLMLRLSPATRGLTYTALAVLVAAAVLYQTWRVWPVTAQPIRLFVPLLTVAAVLSATSGLHVAALLAVWTLVTLPRGHGWGRAAVTVAAAAPLLIATVQTLQLSGPTPLLLLGLALPGVLWWPAAQRVVAQIPPRIHAAVSAALTVVTLAALIVRLGAL